MCTMPAPLPGAKVENNKIINSASFQLFSKIWPTLDTHKYFPYLETVSYGEKLMGKSFTAQIPSTQQTA